jgi:hypothetical protein
MKNRRRGPFDERKGNGGSNQGKKKYFKIFKNKNKII